MGERFGYQPALDGLRAVSIALVLAFHLDWSWLGGGYLGVSVFFTLSGFLITSLLLAERDATGRIDVRAFYLRRLRRLLPASLVCLGLVVLLAALGVVAERSDLRTGILGALLQVANWEALLGDRSYADLFLAPSPVDHFWSLAIEEQFYWLWPVAMAGLTAVCTSARHRAMALGSLFAALGVAAWVTATTLGGDAAYFASWARFAEIVAGAALAAVVAARPSVPARAAVLAPVCLLAIVVLSVVTPAGEGWAYAGGLPLFSLLTVGTIVGLQVDGPVTRLLSRESLARVGRVSYGLYLFHWPVFVVLDAEHSVVKLGVTVALTVVSYHLVERPVRARHVLASGGAYVRAAGGALALTGALALLLVPVATSSSEEERPTVLGTVPVAATAPMQVTAPPVGEVPAGPSSTSPSTAAPGVASTTTPTSTPTTPTTVPLPPTPAVVAVLGDSIADWLLRDAAATFDRTDVAVIDGAIAGCDGAVGIPTARSRGDILELPDGCVEWPVSYAEAVEQPGVHVDVAVLMVGHAPIVDRLVDGRWVGPCEGIGWYEADLADRVDYLRTHVDDVVLALPSWGGERAAFLAGEEHLGRMGCIRSALTAFAAGVGLDVIDLASLLCPDGPGGACNDLRENDGTHIDPEDAPGTLDWVLDAVT